MKSILVTGGTGFIGSSLVSRLRKEMPIDEKVFAPSSSEVDLVNREDSLKWFERLHWLNEVSHIYHLAAIYKAGGWPATHPGTQFHANMQINLNVLEGWKRFFPSARLISVVSYCMYPDHNKPHPEEELWGTEPEPYLFSYAFTKKALLVGQKAYSQEFGLSASSLVLPTVYGKNADFSETSHVIGALIGKFVRACENKEPSVEVWGDGSQIREFIHVSDVVEALIRISDASTKSSVFNLGSERGRISVKDLAETIRDIVQFEGDIIYNSNKFTGAKQRVLDSSKILKEIEWAPKIDLREGLKEVVQHYKNNLNI